MRKTTSIQLVILFLIQPLLFCHINAQNSKTDSLIQLLQSQDNDTLKVRLLIDIANAFYQKDLKLAMKYSVDARKLSEKTNYKTGMINSYIELAKNYILQFQLDSAMVLTARAIEIADENNYIKLAAIASRWNGVTYKLSEKYDKALASFHHGESLAIQTNDSILLGTIYREIGNVYMNEELYETSLKFLLHSLEIRLKTKNQIKATLADLGTVNAKLQRYSTALEYHKQQLDMSLKVNDWVGAAYAYSDMGIVYSELKDLDKALDCHLKSLQYALQVKHYLSAGIANINLAEVYGKKRDFEEALNNVKLAFKNFETDGGFPLGEFTAYSTLAEIYLKMDHLDLAGQTLLKAETYRKEINDNDANKSFLDIAAKVYKAKKNWQKAFEYSQQYYSLKDSLDKKNNFRQIEDIRTKYNTERKEIENETLKNENTSKSLLIRRQFYFNISVTLIALLGLLLAFLFFRFQKKQKATNHILEIQNKELSKLNATKDKFFSIIAHDLKNPFNSILGLSEILKDQVKTQDIPAIGQYAKQINTIALQTYQLLENLLKWAKTQQGKITYNPVPLLLNEVAAGIVGLFSEQTARKKIRLISHIRGDLIVMADEEMLNSIIRNLVSNAIKFTASEGQVQLNAVVNKSFVEISVTDTGTGISKESLDKLFKVDTNISTPGTENEKGTGLGLLLCREFVEKHGGKIWIVSELGKGSTFRFSIPKM